MLRLIYTGYHVINAYIKHTFMNTKEVKMRNKSRQYQDLMTSQIYAEGIISVYPL